MEIFRVTITAFYTDGIFGHSRAVFDAVNDFVFFEGFQSAKYGATVGLS